VAEICRMIRFVAGSAAAIRNAGKAG